ncbi:uncharacterized protein LOC144762283 [Lissotriton helveticus]
MERPRDKLSRSPHGHRGSRHSHRSVNGSRPRSLSPDAPRISRPRSPYVAHRSRPRSPHGSRPRSPHGSRPRSPHSHYGSRPRSPHGSRPRSPHSRYGFRPRSPHGFRPRSPHSHYGSRPRSPHGSRPRSPHDFRRSPPRSDGSRPRSPHSPPGSRARYSHVLRSRSPYGPHGHRLRSRSPMPRSSRSPMPRSSRSPMPRSSRSPRPRSSRTLRSRSPQGYRGLRSNSPLPPLPLRPFIPHGPRELSPLGLGMRSPLGDRPRSPSGLYPYHPHSPGPLSPLRSPYRHPPGGSRRSFSPGHRSPHGYLPSPSRGPPEVDSSRWPLTCGARPRDPEDLRYRLTRPSQSSDGQRWSPRGDRAAVDESLRITVGNDFFNSSSPDRTRLSGSLDDVSCTSRDELIEECIMTREHLLSRQQNTSEVEQCLSPLTVRNDIDYRQRNATHRPTSLSPLNNRCSLDDYRVSHPEDLEIKPMKSRRKNQNDQEHGLPFQHEGFVSNSGFGRNRSPLTNSNVLQHSNIQFSFRIENFTEKKYKTLEQFKQTPIPILSEKCFPSDGERCSILDKKVDSDSFSRFLPHNRTSIHEDRRVSNNLSIAENELGVREKMFLPRVEEEVFLYGNSDSYGREPQPSTQSIGTSVREQVAGVMEDKHTDPNLTSTQEATIAHQNHPELQKIQDLLKTIGVDIGDAEIGKLSVRTQERLYGKNLPSNSRQGHSSEAQLQELYQIRNRSETRSPESNHKHSRSPTWSMQTSKNRLSYTKSEISEKDEDSGQELPIPSLGQQQTISSLGQQQTISSLGQQQAISSLGQQQAISSLGQQQAISSLGQQQAISSLGQQQAISSLGQQQAISSLGQQQAISSLGQHQAISSLEHQQAIYMLRQQQQSTPLLGQPLNIAPHQRPMMLTAPHLYQMTTFAQHTTAQMLPALMTTAPPSSPFLPPNFVPNTSIPPPVFFPPPPMPNFTDRPNTQIPPPSMQPPFFYGGLGHGMPPKGPIPSGPPDPFLRTSSKRRNLKVIQTITESDKEGVKPVKMQKQDSCHLVYIDTLNSSTKSTPPSDDKNRVAQKVKVLRDLEKIKSDRFVRGKKLAFLQKKLESLIKRHGDILQNKAQQNKFHTNPLLAQAKRIEDELVALCKAAAEADEQQSSLEKVAKILGLNISEKSNPSAQSQKTEEKRGMGSNTAKSSVPVEPKAQTQVGTATSS